MSAMTDLQAENVRLADCLKKANASSERFEREWYLRGDEIERLSGELEKATAACAAQSIAGEALRQYCVSNPEHILEIPDAIWEPFLAALQPDWGSELLAKMKAMEARVQWIIDHSFISKSKTDGKLALEISIEIPAGKETALSAIDSATGEGGKV